MAGRPVLARRRGPQSHGLLPGSRSRQIIHGAVYSPGVRQQTHPAPHFAAIRVRAAKGNAGNMAEIAEVVAQHSGLLRKAHGKSVCRAILGRSICQGFASAHRGEKQGPSAAALHLHFACSLPGSNGAGGRPPLRLPIGRALHANLHLDLPRHPQPLTIFPTHPAVQPTPISDLYDPPLHYSFF